MIVIEKFADPKPGQEAAFSLAWKHRAIAGTILANVPWWRPRKWRKAYRLWAWTVDRTKRHGRDRVMGLGPARAPAP
jgi:hypothetical protein